MAKMQKEFKKLKQLESSGKLSDKQTDRLEILYETIFK